MRHSYQSFLSELEFVKKYTLTIACSRSNKEVYTPNSLAQDMLSKIPEVFWTSPTNHVMDPCVKSGIFLMQSIENFMRGLESWQPCVEKRFKHIVENQIYGFCCSSWAHKMVNKSIFGDMMHIGHIYNYQFLDSGGEISIVVKELINKENMKFDCIVGNPPYQNGPKGSSGKLWMDFVKLGIKSLTTDGYLCFVHPITWRTMANKMWVDIYQKFQVVYAKIEPAVTWSVGVKVDWYILRNSPYLTKTVVEFSDETKELDFTKIIGINNSSVVDKIFIVGDKISVKQTHEFDTRRDFISESETKKFIFPIKHTGASELKWSSKEHPWQKKKKVLISDSGYLSPFYDNGKLGTTQHCYAIFVSSKVEGDYIVRLLNSKLYKFVQSNTKTSGFNDIKILNLLPYPKALSDNFTDADLYAHFNLTDDEIKLVESAIKD